jgi:hypothetical protein
MRIEVHVHGDIFLTRSTARADIEAALQPLLDYLDVDTPEEATSLYSEEPGIALDRGRRILEICWSGYIGRSFQQCLEQALLALGPCTERASEVTASLYHDNGENETRVFFVGPTSESIRGAQRQRMVEDVGLLLSRQFTKEAVDEVVALVNQLFERDSGSAAVGLRWESHPAAPTAPGSPARGRKRLH